MNWEGTYGLAHQSLSGGCVPLLFRPREASLTGGAGWRETPFTSPQQASRVTRLDKKNPAPVLLLPWSELAFLHVGSRWDQQGWCVPLISP